MALREDNGTYCIVILGATGDLAHKKLIPALAALSDKNLLEPATLIIGVGRSAMTQDNFRASFDLSTSIAQKLFYHQSIPGLKQFIKSKTTVQTIICFFALPPEAYGDTAAELYAEGFGSDVRIVIEKPFGYDLDSARKLNQQIHTFFSEEQIYRIDHYLAKEAVQNIMAFRFANFLFSHIWNNSCIDMIQINAFEDTFVGKRSAYFDNVGIIRDMVQNHLLQLLSLLCMEIPVSLRAEDIAFQKINVLKCLKIVDVCKFQYEGYTNEVGVRSDSRTETFVEMKLFIDNFRWYGVPIYIRTGKALHRKGTEIGILFKPYPQILFNANSELQRNKIIFKIQPSAGIIVDMSSKVPGWDMQITSTNMAFCYRDTFSAEIPEAYQRLLMDVILAEKSLFVSNQEIEIAWKCIEPFLDTGPLHYYKKGELPQCPYQAPWIDFEKYISLC